MKRTYTAELVLSGNSTDAVAAAQRADDALKQLNQSAKNAKSDSATPGREPEHPCAAPVRH
ncbi:MAG: hypothetical protein OIF57_00850 [Marinobacterium sp.]|nr:hypothetical protein [Marinobacterium sp.]